jgi:molybdate transport system ATP-binding protein
MRNVRVTYGDSVIFDNINWEIRPGDCWALSGPNGSGKSTLLSLINGDHPQAYANDIVLFDKKRGSGESIWDIKKRIGFMSPELFQYFPYHFTCLQVVESGFYDTIGLLRQSQQQNRQIAEKWMSLMGLFSVRENRLSEIPASQQRMCLLARALVKNPYLLMLDEPCLGFDQSQQQAFKRLIEAMAKLSDLAIIYVTHHKETLPDSITKTLTLG